MNPQTAMSYILSLFTMSTSMVTQGANLPAGCVRHSSRRSRCLGQSRSHRAGLLVQERSPS